MGKMGNIPALDAGAQILEELGAIGRRLDRIESRLDSTGYNAVARFTNTMAARIGNQLIPLKTQRNESIQDSPMALDDIDGASLAELDRLLQRHGLPTVGVVAVLKARLKNYLGTAMVGV